MPTINDFKELEVPGTPIFLFDCVLSSGDAQHWSTHELSCNGQQYLPRVLAHNVFDLRSSPDATADAVAKVSITLANADSFLSPIERDIGWKGAQLTVTLLFYDLSAGASQSDPQVVFYGVGEPTGRVDRIHSALELYESA